VIKLFLLLNTKLAVTGISVAIPFTGVESFYRFSLVAITAYFRINIRYFVGRSILEPLKTDFPTLIFAFLALATQAIASASVVIKFRQLLGLVTPVAPLQCYHFPRVSSTFFLAFCHFTPILTIFHLNSNMGFQKTVKSAREKTTFIVHSQPYTQPF